MILFTPLSGYYFLVYLINHVVHEMSDYNDIKHSKSIVYILGAGTTESLEVFLKNELK